MYYTFIYPYFLYCNEVWGNTCGTHLHCLKILQKRAIRIIFKSGIYDHTDPLFNQLKVLKFVYIHKYCVVQFLYRVKHKLLSNLFNDMFILNSDIHAYGTRQLGDFHVPYARTNLVKNTITYNGVVLWNDVIKLVCDDCSLTVFKQRIKRNLLYTQLD